MTRAKRTRVGINKKTQMKTMGSNHGGVCRFMCEIQMRESMGWFRPFTQGTVAMLQ